jgi:type II secretory ATPase GspE/PulE/Tfp pilus assembly ATPase PilB-like protein
MPRRGLRFGRAKEIGLAKEREIGKSKPPLFTTMEMGPYLELTTSKAGEADAFQWPAPPYFEFVRGGDHQGPEECLLIFKDGTKAAGQLMEFRPDETLLKFQPADANVGIIVAFSSLLSLRLLRLIQLKPEGHPLGVAEGEMFAPSERQPFNVDLVNGKKLQGETTGFVDALCGLFLYLPAEDSGVTRWFVPAQAIQASSIGAPIGQLLIDQNLASPESVDAALKKQREMRAQRLGEYLTENQIVSPDQLAAALKRQHTRPVLRLGESLIELGFLTEPELAEAQKIQSQNRKMPLGQILLSLGIVNSEVIKAVMAHKLGIPFVNLRKFKVAPDILGKVPARVAYRYRIVPMCESEGGLVVATENPLGKTSLDELRFVTGMKMIPVMASEEDIRYALENHYGAARRAGGTAHAKPGRRGPDELAVSHAAAGDIGIEELASRLAAETGELELGEQQAVESDSALVRLVNKIILDAVEQKASDIHIESNPGQTGTRIRFRRDGTLVDYLELSSRFRRAVISRVKIMSQLDITERRKPQDGKIDFSRFGPLKVELRVTTVPTKEGLEDVVMRVLAAATPVPIEQVGFDAQTLATMKRLISKPQGLMLVCGPTGSGKTTTLHSLLGFLNTSESKIWTAEDPIEITQAGLRQVQVNSKIGWTFAAAMRSFLRADPDVVMVGEMRDAETTKMGIEASLTGHLVLSTLHTNSAPECIVRLLDLGMDPFNFADALLGILAQRLARRLCPACKEAYTPTSANLDELLREYCLEASLDAAKVLTGWRERYPGRDGKITLYRARGCERCNRTGYQGRLGLYELLVGDPAVKRAVQSRAPVADVKSAAVAAGMRTLKQDGIDKVLQGLTDMNQVRAVCG